MEIEVVARKICRFFEADSDAAAVYLFGSLARGSAGPASDIDIGLLLKREPPATLQAQPFDLESTLSRQLGRPVQIVVLNRAPVDLSKRVLRDGVLLLDHDRSARIAFEVDVRRRFFDLEPFLKRYRKREGSSP